MKKDRYDVIYLNGKQETFTCNGFNEAIVKAMAKAYDMAWDSKIQSITDESGVTITDIQSNFSYKIA